jgi:predicted GTPase
MGAAGRDFHTFNTYFRNYPDYAVVAFTATQSRYRGSSVSARVKWGTLSARHSDLSEEQLEELIHREHIQQVIFAYSDVSHLAVMHLASRVLACGADFRLLGPAHSLLTSARPVISVCAVRTGCGKGMVVRRLVTLVRQHGLRPVVVRHPMPYGDLEQQTSSVLPQWKTAIGMPAHSKSARNMSSIFAPGSSCTLA